MGVSDRANDSQGRRDYVKNDVPAARSTPYIAGAVEISAFVFHLMAGKQWLELALNGCNRVPKHA